MMASLLLFIAVFSPFILAVVWWSRKFAREVKQAELAHLPFAPEAPPDNWLNRLLTRFPAEQRTYLAQQLKLAGIIYLIFSWTYCFLLCAPVFNISLSTSTWTNPSAHIWYLYMHIAAGSFHFLLTLITMMGVLIASPLRFGAEARFYRTRPVSLRLIFWSRYLPMFTALIAAAATGAALSLLVMYLVRGPIWQHLPPTIPAPLGPLPLSADDTERVQNYIALLQSSLPRIFLSLLTTMALFFSAVTAIFLVPVNRWAGRTFTIISLLPMIIAIFLLPMFVNIFSDIGELHYPRLLFIYDTLGPPPPYAYALVPIALTIAFTFLARAFVNKLEA